MLFLVLSNSYTCLFFYSNTANFNSNTMTPQQSISGQVLEDYKLTVLISSSMNCFAQLNLFPCQLLFFFLNTKVVTVFT